MVNVVMSVHVRFVVVHVDRRGPQTGRCPVRMMTDSDDSGRNEFSVELFERSSPLTVDEVRRETRFGS